MDFPVFLAMTPTQFAHCPVLPPHPAWMGCRFSVNGQGLEGIPVSLPPDSILMLTDENPLTRHDPKQIAGELRRLTEKLRCHALVLDLQRPPTPRAVLVVDEISNSLSCPVLVTEAYARERHCDILASPALWEDPRAVMARWPGRTVWLELAPEAALVTVTEKGSTLRPCPMWHGGTWQVDEALQVEYQTCLETDRLLVRLRRTGACLDRYRALACQLGFCGMLSMYE